jgi:hypothetical protein
VSEKQTRHGSGPKIAGIWLIVTGSIAVVVVLVTAFFLWAVAQGLAVGFGDPGNAPLPIILVIGLILAVPGIIALIGGLNALKRRRWGLALAGSICAMLYFNVLAVPALVFLVLSKKEFLPTVESLKR